MHPVYYITYNQFYPLLHPLYRNNIRKIDKIWFLQNFFCYFYVNGILLIKKFLHKFNSKHKFGEDFCHAICMYGFQGGFYLKMGLSGGLSAILPFRILNPRCLVRIKD